MSVPAVIQKSNTLQNRVDLFTKAFTLQDKIDLFHTDLINNITIKISLAQYKIEQEKLACLNDSSIDFSKLDNAVKIYNSLCKWLNVLKGDTAMSG